MESRLQTEKVRIDSEVSGVGSVMQFQQAMLQGIRSGIHILQKEDNQIVDEATDLFAGLRQEQEALSKRISHNSLRILAVRTSNQAIQRSLATVTLRIDELKKAMVAIATSLKDVPSKRELRQHQSLMEDQFAPAEDINTRLTTAMEAYNVSESTPFHAETMAGPSGTQNWMHPQRIAAMDQLSASVSSLRDTESEISWRSQLRGGAGSNGGQGSGAAGRQDGRAAGGQDGEATGGPGGNGDPPPDPPPSDHGHPRKRMSRRRRKIKELEFAKPIEIREAKRFEGKPGDDFDMRWILVQVYLEDQPE